MKKPLTTIDRYKGCLYGIAVGDALGAPVEFLSFDEILQRYGNDGITQFEPWAGFKAGSFTDDTQMSLATAVGCLRAYQRLRGRGIWHPASIVHGRYLKWLETQSEPAQRRAPGNSCLSVLASGRMGTIEDKINNSKGCGGVMRTAPAGLAFKPGEAFLQGAEFAALTHGHPTGYLTGGFIAELVSHIIAGKELEPALDAATEQLVQYPKHQETLEKLSLARKLAGRSKSSADSISEIGAGWIGEEALAIAVYCALRFRDAFKQAVRAAVNHSGDSDSTGSIAGSILGTLLGVKAIPSQWVKQVENSARIAGLAKDMFEAFVEEQQPSLRKYPAS